MATPVSSALKLSARDFLALPEDGKQYQLIEGEVYVTPSPNVLHQRLVGRLFVALSRHFATPPTTPIGEVLLSPLDVELDEANVFQPDLFVVVGDRAKLAGASRFVGAPDIVVEVLSRSTAHRDRTMKMQVYGRAGVREMWIVDPDAATIEVFRRGTGGMLTPVATLRDSDTLETPLLPGFSLALDPFFTTGE